jgi:hypothetical protein
MTRKEKRLTFDLFSEYRKNAVRKVYKGSRSDIKNQEGYAWLSHIMNRWCFVPVRQAFTIDTVILVNSKHLYNL